MPRGFPGASRLAFRLIIAGMPSIEIVCVGQERPLEFPDLPFAVASETALLSHRKPSLFQADFDALKGCLYHLGNPGLKDPSAPGAFFAWEILSPECQGQDTFLHFAEEHGKAVRALMDTLWLASPVRRLVFTSDHQFGPPAPARFLETSLLEFWRLHESRQLRMNALYPIARSLP
jgi:hypothetical protein